MIVGAVAAVGDSTARAGKAVAVMLGLPGYLRRQRKNSNWARWTAAGEGRVVSPQEAEEM
jgi:uncharacterized membrane protein